MVGCLVDVNGTVLDVATGEFLFSTTRSRPRPPLPSSFLCHIPTLVS